MSKKKKHHSSHSSNMELGDSGVAHLPAESVMREYPKIQYDNWSSDFDTPAGVDRQMNADADGARRQKSHTKY